MKSDNLIVVLPLIVKIFFSYYFKLIIFVINYIKIKHIIH